MHAFLFLNFSFNPNIVAIFPLFANCPPMYWINWITIFCRPAEMLRMYWAPSVRAPYTTSRRGFCASAPYEQSIWITCWPTHRSKQLKHNNGTLCLWMALQRCLGSCNKTTLKHVNNSGFGEFPSLWWAKGCSIHRPRRRCWLRIS